MPTKKKMSFGRKVTRAFLPGPLGTVMEILFYLTLLAEAVYTGRGVYTYQTSRDALKHINRPAAVEEYVAGSTSISAHDIGTFVNDAYETSRSKILQQGIREQVSQEDLEGMLRAAAPYAAAVLGIDKVNVPRAFIKESDRGAFMYDPKTNEITLMSLRRTQAKYAVATALIPAQWMTESNWSVLNRAWRLQKDEALVNSGKFFNAVYRETAAIEILSRMALGGDDEARHAALLALRSGFNELVANGYDGNLREDVTPREVMALVAMQAYSGKRETLRGMQLDGTAKLLNSVIDIASRLTVNGVDYIIKLPA